MIFRTVFMLVLVPVLGLILTGFGARDVTKGGQETTAFVMCQRPVTQRLRSPSSAKFPTITTPGARSVHAGGGRYIVDGFVDAQNGFGAMLRSKWECEIKENADKTWSLLNLKIN